jgi:hypothetical protein
MRKAILASMFLAMAVMVVDLPAQTKRKPRKQKPDPYLVPKESPCGVPTPTGVEFAEELRQEWRVAAASKEAVYFYNTHRVTCGAGGVLSTWIKGTYDDAATSIASMSRYEMKCHANQLRITSQIEYYKDGQVKSSRTYKKPEWDEVAPDSVGERLLETLCHKKV